MKDSTKDISKMLGTENAESAVHLYAYLKYISHYLYNMGKKTPFIKKRPPQEIPPDMEEIVEILANRVMREIATVETSTYHGKVVPLDGCWALAVAMRTSLCSRSATCRSRSSLTRSRATSSCRTPTASRLSTAPAAWCRMTPACRWTCAWRWGIRSPRSCSTTAS